MKNLIIYIIALLILFSSCKLAQEPSAKPYNSIQESKNNNAFVAELRPEQPYFEIEGHKHYIKAAWIEHPHNETNWGDVVGTGIYCYVMELEYYPKLEPDLKEYINELGNGPTRIWSFLTHGREKDDIKLKYRTSKNDIKKDKVFMLYRK